MAGRVRAVRRAPGCSGRRRCALAVHEPAGDRARVDGVLGFAVVVGGLHEARSRRSSSASRTRSTMRPTFWFFSTVALAMLALMRLLPVSAAGGLSAPVNAGICGRRQVGVDVVDAVDVAVVDELAGARSCPTAAAGRRAMLVRHICGNLKSVVGERQLVARCRRAGDIGGLVVVRVGVERPRRGVAQVSKPVSTPVLPIWLEIHT